MSTADVAQAVLKVMRESIYPLISQEQIGYCSPDDVGDKYMLGIYICDLKKDPVFQTNNNIPIDRQVSLKPPVCMEMSLMITSYIGKKSSVISDLKLLDRVIQTWNDGIEIPYTSSLQPKYIPPARISLLSPNIDEISKMWQFFNEPYRQSLFYKISPIAISSKIQMVTERVRDSELQIQEGHR